MKSSQDRKKWLKAVALNLVGVGSALLIAELCLSPFASGKGSLPGADQTLSGDDPMASFNEKRIFEIKQFQEGFAVSHFAYDGRRLTGNAEITSAASGIVIGDSFVEAQQVKDEDTMGAQIEHLAQEDQTPVNVRQYGWGGTSVATYIAVANELNRKWNPEWVAVLFNDDDFSEESIASGRFWRMEIDPVDSAVKLVRVPRAGGTLDPLLANIGLRSGDVRSWLSKSSLAYLAIEKYFLSIGQPDHGGAAISDPDAMIRQQEKVVKALIPQLKRAYPENLIIVFIPQIGVTSDKNPQTIERILSDTCAQEQVKFVSTRQAMIRARDVDNALSEGFVNTIPGGGHLNPLGHKILANEIWQAVNTKK